MIKRVFGITTGGNYDDWKFGDVNHSVAILTCKFHNKCEEFSLKDMYPTYKMVYNISHMNQIFGSDSEGLVKHHLQLLSALVMRKHIDFGYLVYNQIVDPDYYSN